MVHKYNHPLIIFTMKVDSRKEVQQNHPINIKYRFLLGLADEEVVGDKSGEADDDKSTATCPSGFVVKYCEAKTGN